MRRIYVNIMISFLFLYQWFDFDELYQFLFLPIFRISRLSFLRTFSQSFSFAAIYPFITTKEKKRQKKTEFPFWLYNINSLLSDNGKHTTFFFFIFSNFQNRAFDFYCFISFMFCQLSFRERKIVFVPFSLPLLQKVLFHLNPII